MIEQLTIERQYHGPPASGHGGYVCGLVAGLVGGTAEVTLRRPPPLDKSLSVERLDGGCVALRDGETVVAEGTPTSHDIEVREPVTLTEAEKAARVFQGLRHHAFPSCFGCGPQRPEGEGLRIFPGRLTGGDVVAAPWTPHASLAGEDDTVRPEFVWAALDCPGGWAWSPAPGLSSLVRPVVLGRLAAKRMAPVRCGEHYVVIGWRLGENGRKLYSGTALFSHDGELSAIARATWLRLE